MMLDEVGHGTAMDEAVSVFQPDSLLPAQFFENFCQKVRTEPEISLMLAVLEDALGNYQKHFTSHRGRGMRIFRETEEWIYREKSSRPFAFSSICDVVGLDPDYIRQGLLKWRQAKINEMVQGNFAAPDPAKVKRPKAAHPERRKAA